MKTRIERQVDHLFKNAPDRSEEIRENPVTGGSFVAGLDPIRSQKVTAQNALKARALFAEHKPDDLPDLPLRQDDRERLKVDGACYILALYARSLAYRDYRTDGRPNFDEYARGVMASHMTPEWIREDAQLLRRYPPVPLNGIGPGLIWRGR